MDGCTGVRHSPRPFSHPHLNCSLTRLVNSAHLTEGKSKGQWGRGGHGAFSWPSALWRTSPSWLSSSLRGFLSCCKAVGHVQWPRGSRRGWGKAASTVGISFKALKLLNTQSAERHLSSRTNNILPKQLFSIDLKLLFSRGGIRRRGRKGDNELGWSQREGGKWRRTLLQWPNRSDLLSQSSYQSSHKGVRLSKPASYKSVLNISAWQRGICPHEKEAF